MAFDEGVSSDGNGSLRIQALWPPVTGQVYLQRPKTVEATLVESGDIDVERARLIYRAKIRVGLYMNSAPRLTMLIHYPEYDADEYDIVWNLPNPGTFHSFTEPDPGGWFTEEVVYDLEDGENPDNIKLAVRWNAMPGAEALLADDIVLLKGPRENLECNATPMVEMARELVAGQPGADQLVCPPGEKCPKLVICFTT